MSLVLEEFQCCIERAGRHTAEAHGVELLHTIERPRDSVVTIEATVLSGMNWLLGPLT